MARRNSWASYVIWGCLAVCAVLGASLTLALVVGSQRGIQIAAPATAPAIIAKQASPSAAPVASAVQEPSAEQREIARLKDTLRSVAAERDRLAARIEQLEQSADITASVGDEAPAPRLNGGNQDRIAAAPTQPAPPIPEPAAAKTLEVLRPYVTVQPLVGEPSPERTPMQIRAAPHAASEGVTRTAFAIDLGTGSSLEILRARWSALRGNHAGALAELSPLVSVREDTKTGVELRLLAGPFANAEAAARACAALEARKVPCQTAVYEGQRLALR
jgi:hypothetical protein